MPAPVSKLEEISGVTATDEIINRRFLTRKAYGSNEIPNNPMSTLGFYPAERVEFRSIETYLANEGLSDYVRVALQRYERESEKDFAKRLENAYPIKLVRQMTKYLCQTIDNEKHKTVRQFTGRFKPLQALASKPMMSGKSLENILKVGEKDALLGGISYLFLDVTKLGEVIPLTDAKPAKPPTATEDGAEPESAPETDGQLEVRVLRFDQVWNVLVDDMGHFKQCEISEETPTWARRLLYFTTEKDSEWVTHDGKKRESVAAGTPVFIEYSQDRTQQASTAVSTDSSKPKYEWKITDVGINTLGAIPIVPLYFGGDITRKELESPIHGVTPFEADAMNTFSQLKRGFYQHVYPRVLWPNQTGPAIPRPEAPAPRTSNTRAGGNLKYTGETLDTPTFIKHRQNQMMKWNADQQIASGENVVWRYDNEKGKPEVLVPPTGFVQAGLDLLLYYRELAIDAVGVSRGKESTALADSNSTSGIAKSFDFNDTNETHREINAVMQRAELHLWWLVAMAKFGITIDMKGDSPSGPDKDAKVLSLTDIMGTEAMASAADGQDGSGFISIARSNQFDPLGDTAYKKLKEFISHPTFNQLPVEIREKSLILYAKESLKDFVGHDELEKLLESAKFTQPVPIPGVEDDELDNPANDGNGTEPGRNGPGPKLPPKPILE